MMMMMTVVMMMQRRRGRIEIVMLMTRQSFDLIMKAVKIAILRIEESIDLLIGLMSLESIPDGWDSIFGDRESIPDGWESILGDTESIPDGWKSILGDWKSIPADWMKTTLVTST